MALKKRESSRTKEKAPGRGQGRRVLAKAAPPVGFVLITGITLVLFLQFLGERPLNLRPHSNAVAHGLQQLLGQNNLPPENIIVAEAEPRQAEEGAWNYHRFQVIVPATVSMPGLQEVVRRYILQQYEGGISVTQTEPNRLQIAFGEWVLADLDFQAAAPPPRQDLTAATDRLAEDVGAALREMGIAETDLAWVPSAPSEDEEAHWRRAQVRVNLAPEVTVQSIAEQLEARMAGRDVALRIETTDRGDAVIRVAFAGRDAVDVVVTRAADPLMISELPPLDALSLDSADYPNGDTPEGQPGAIGEVKNPRIAIILDDGGYGGAATDAALALTHPVTFALLPDTPAVTETALRAAERGFELMLHMPMAASGADAVPFPGELTEGMDAETIQRATRAALAQIPGVAGVNNHTGSAFTTHAEGMRPFLEVVIQEGLYFVDSFTSPDSVGLELARNMEIPNLRRDVFLDNDPAPDAIAAQVDKLIERAQTAGFAVGIGHFRDTTLAVLEGLLERIRLAGIELVFVSELLP